MISALIFSKDRAMQLDGLLRSYFRWSSEPLLARLTVLFAASDGRFRRQYQDLGREYQGQVHFAAETDFRKQVLDLIGASRTTNPWWSPTSWSSRRPGSSAGAPQATSPTHILFLVDDALFVRPFNLRLAAEALNVNQDALGFSFRLGANTVKSYVLGRPQQVPSWEHLPNRVRKYRWPQADGDFAYPLELSSSFYRAETIVRLMRGAKFSDPNTLESQLSIRAPRLRRRYPFLLCWDSSVAFSAPVNRVQDVFENRSGAAADLSVGHLASLFETGKRLDLGALEGFVPSACHQEVRLSFMPLSPDQKARSFP